MPADQQLGCTICSDSRCFTFTDHRMAREIGPLLMRENVGSLDVITFHRHLADVVQQRCGVQRSAIVTSKVKRLCDLISDNGDTLRVRVLVALKLIDSLRELYERFGRRAIDQVCTLNCHHSCNQPEKSQKHKC